MRELDEADKKILAWVYHETKRDIEPAAYTWSTKWWKLYNQIKDRSWW